MRIYLAARYHRLRELRSYADELRALGHHVTAHWIERRQEAPGPLDHPSWAGIAQQDVQDISESDAVIIFAEPHRVEEGGGRHTEFGMGLAWGKRMVVVGRAEHLFHTLPSVEVYPTWRDALRGLAAD